MVQIGTTNRCNEKCVFCPNPTMTKAKGVMGLGMFRRIVEENEAGIYDLCNFGEPLLDAGIAEKIRLIRELRPAAEIYFHTNGKLLVPRKADELHAAGLSRIVVSIYGFGQERMAEFMPLGNWNLVVQNVAYCARLIPTMVVGTPTDQVEMATRFWEALGCTTHYNSITDYEDHVTGPKVVAPIQKCTFALGYRTFDWDGAMVMCCMDFNSKTKFGQVGVDDYEAARARVTSASGFCETCALRPELAAYLGVE